MDGPDVEECKGNPGFVFERLAQFEALLEILQCTRVVALLAIDKPDIIQQLGNFILLPDGFDDCSTSLVIFQSLPIVTLLAVNVCDESQRPGKPSSVSERLAYCHTLLNMLQRSN